MKFSVGDRVLLKRTGEEGFITAFLNKQIMEVDVAGTRFPVYADEVDHPYLKWFTEQKPAKSTSKREIPVEKAHERKQRLSRGIYLSFIPQFIAGISDDIIESYSIHLLNETAEHIAFQYDARTVDGVSLLQLKGRLHPFANLFLHTVSLEDLNAQPRFHWQVASTQHPDRAIKNLLRIRPAQLVRFIQELLLEAAPSFSILLAPDTEGLPLQPPAEPLKSISFGEESRVLPVQLHTEAVPVLDLHIQQLVPEWAELNSAGILALQLAQLRRKLDAGLAGAQAEMIVIHGIGSGSLRLAVHDELRNTPYVKSFSNHWMPAYGWGATKIIFTEK